MNTVADLVELAAKVREAHLVATPQMVTESCFYNNLNVTSPILIVRSHVCRLYNMSVQRFRVHVQTISRLQASQL